MRTTLIILRWIGLLGSAWIIYIALYSHYQMVFLTREMGPGSPNSVQFMTVHLWRSTIPFLLLAILIALPYGRMHKIFSLLGVILISYLAFHFMTVLYGLFFSPVRFVPRAIPTEVWIFSSIFAAFFLSQIAAILIQTKNFERGS